MSDKGYTSAQIAELCQISNQRARTLIRAQGWPVVGQEGRVKFYDQEAIDAYLEARTRTHLHRELGSISGGPGQPLWTDDAHDLGCPECGGLAVRKKMPLAQEIAFLAGNPVFCLCCGEAMAVEWLCENGHSGQCE